MFKHRKEKQAELIQAICKDCFKNNVDDSIKVIDEYSFELKITRPNDTLLLTHFIHALDQTPVRDVRFSSVPNGIQMFFSTLHMIATAEQKYTRVKARESTAFPPPKVVMGSLCSPGAEKLPETNQLWINSIGTYLMKNLPIPVEPGVVAHHGAGTDGQTTWVQAVLDDSVTLRELKQCIEMDGVKEIELATKKNAFVIKIICGLEKSLPLKHLKKSTDRVGQNVVSSKADVHRFVREERVDKRQKQQGRYEVPRHEADEESVSLNESSSIWDDDT
jgi:hypothetical protein